MEVEVTLRGLTVLNRVRAAGERLPFEALPEHLQGPVRDGRHPHLRVVDVVDEQTEPSLEAEAEEAPDLSALTALHGVSDEIARDLWLRGLRTADDLREASDEELLDVPGIGKATLAAIRKRLAE